MGRLATALAVSAGALAAIYVGACVLPNGPSDAGRVQFTLDFPVPGRVPLAGVVEPRISISADGQVLKNPAYRLESLDPSIVRVVGSSGDTISPPPIDPAGRRLQGVARGTTSVRVVYQTAMGAPFFSSTMNLLCMITPGFCVRCVQTAVKPAVFAAASFFFQVLSAGLLLCRK